MSCIPPERGVEKAVNNWIDGIINEERLHAELVHHLPHGIEFLLKILDNASQHHDNKEREKAEDVGKGDGEEHRGRLSNTQRLSSTLFNESLLHGCQRGLLRRLATRVLFNL